MADVFSKQKRSEVMAKIRSKDTKIELVAFKFLRKQKIYFKKHYNGVSGKPDVAMVSKKKALFIDGDFWHGRDYLKRINRLPPYWKLKIEANMRRDKKYRRLLKKAGWSVMRVWEYDLERRTQKTLKRILAFLSQN